MNSKAEDSIWLMSININGISMTKRGNSKADSTEVFLGTNAIDRRRGIGNEATSVIVREETKQTIGGGFSHEKWIWRFVAM